MVITNDWIGQHATLRGIGKKASGWTAKQAACLGVRWPLKKGWRSQLVGTEISDEKAREFERLGEERRRMLAKLDVETDASWP
jgi:hypothetical protein